MFYLLQAIPPSAIPTALPAVPFDWTWVGAGIGLIIATLLILNFLRHVIMNSILGLVAWAIAVYVFQLPLPFWISLLASAVFGLAGIGAMILLKTLGVV